MAHICKDYGITRDELKTAAAFQLIAGGHLTQGGGDVDVLANRLVKIMNDRELTATIKWATWVKEARKTDAAGQSVDELLKLEKKA